MAEIVRYGGVQIASRLIGFVGIFAFAGWLSPEDYGIMSIHLASVWLVALAVSLNLHVGIGRILFDPDVDSRRFLGSSLVAVSSVAGVLSVLILIFRHSISRLLGLPVEVVVLQVPVAIGLVAELSLVQVMIYFDKSNALFKIVAGKAVVTVVLGVIATALLAEDRYLGLIGADAAVSMSFLLVVYATLKHSVSWSVDRALIRRLAAYSLPLLAYSASLTLLSQSDRVMIGRLVGTPEAGEYGFIYLFGSMVIIAGTPLLNAYQLRFYAAMNRSDFERMGVDTTAVFSILMFLAAAVACLGPPLLALVAPPRFDDGLRILPLVAFGSLVQSNVMLRSRVLLFYEMTSTVAVIVVVPALANVGLNLVGLPQFGYKFAAISTVIAQLLMAIGVAAVLSGRDLPRPSHPKSIAAVSVLILFPYLLDPLWFGLEWIGRLSILVAVGLVVVSNRHETRSALP